MSGDLGNTKYMYSHIFVYCLLPSRAFLCITASWMSLLLLEPYKLCYRLHWAKYYPLQLYSFIKKPTFLWRLSDQRSPLWILSITTLATLKRSRSFQTTEDLFKAPSVPQSVFKLIYKYSLLQRTCFSWPRINQKFRNTTINAFYCSTDDVHRDTLTLKTLPAHTRPQKRQYSKKKHKSYSGSGWVLAYPWPMAPLAGFTIKVFCLRFLRSSLT